MFFPIVNLQNPVSKSDKSYFMCSVVTYHQWLLHQIAQLQILSNKSNDLSYIVSLQFSNILSKVIQREVVQLRAQMQNQTTCIQYFALLSNCVTLGKLFFQIKFLHFLMIIIILSFQSTVTKIISGLALKECCMCYLFSLLNNF